MIKNPKIDHGSAFDWGMASADYAKYRDIYPDEYYKRITDLGLCTNGQRVLDLGTGTGVIPRNMSKYGAVFTGADISENQIAQAKKLTKEAGLNIDYVVASAENFNFPAGYFDVVTACQCFMYFDKEKALPRIHTVLKEGGHFVIVFMTWISSEDEIAKASEDLVLKYNPSWTGARMQREKLVVLPETYGLFTIENAISYDVKIPFTREKWHGRMRACRGIGASALNKNEIALWEKEHLEYLEKCPEEFEILHFVTLFNLRKK